MGEAAHRRSATRRFVEQHPICCFCSNPSTTREHMPPKALFDNSHRPDKLVMPACAECNKGTSTADLIVSVISRWNYNAPECERADHTRLARRARKQAPEAFAEWTEGGLTRKIKGRRHLVKHGIAVPPDAGIATIGRHTIRLLNLFAHKAVLALHYEHMKRPIPISGAYCAIWKTKEDFARNGVPEKLLELFPSYATLVQGQWDEREVFEYRHAENEQEGLFGFFARLRSSFFLTGLVVSDAKAVPADDDEWVQPGRLLALVDTPRFGRKA